MQTRYGIVLLAGLATVGQLYAGLTYTATTTATGAGAGMQNSTLHAAVEGPQARLEFVQSRNPMMGSGTYLLTRDAGQTMYLVKPADKTYFKWDMQEMMNGMKGAMQMAQGMVSIQVTGQKVEKLLEEKGPKLLGHATTHTKFRTAYNLETTMFGSKRVNATTRDEEIWTTEDLKAEGLKAWRKQMSMNTGHADLDKLIAAQREQIKGFPLKQIVTTTTQAAGGQPQTSTLTTEVTELKEASVPASSFELPAGYTEQSMPAMGKPPEAGGPRARGAAPDLNQLLQGLGGRRPPGPPPPPANP